MTTTRMSEPPSEESLVLQRLRRAHRVLVTSHRSPDGDALGSALGLAEMLRLLGVEAQVVNRDPHPASLAFLPGLESVQVVDRLPAGFAGEYDLAVVLECPGLDRPGLDGLDALPIVNIDHHLSNETYGEVNWIDETAPAVGEMVLRLVQAAGVPLGADLATNLYTALVTDTGDFRYANTTPRAFTAATDLVLAGARPHHIAEALWEHVPARVVRLTGAVLQTLEVLAGGRLAVVWCDREMLDRAGAMPEDTENLVNYPRSIDGVEVAVLLKAFAPDSVRVSLRSRGAVDVRLVASAFGGGGHREAAGCTIPMPLTEALKALVKVLIPAVESA